MWHKFWDCQKVLKIPFVNLLFHHLDTVYWESYQRLVSLLLLNCWSDKTHLRVSAVIHALLDGCVGGGREGGRQGGWRSLAEGNKFMKDVVGNAHGAWLHGDMVTRWTTPSTVSRCGSHNLSDCWDKVKRMRRICLSLKLNLFYW